MSQKSFGVSYPVQDPSKIFFSVIGKYPEDVLWPLDTASDVFLQLTEIFRTISEEKNNGYNASRIQYLAKAGTYLANDWAEFFESMHEEMKENFEAFKRGG